MSEKLRKEFYDDDEKNLRPEFLVDVEMKMTRQVHIEADGIKDAEEKVMDMINEDELMFSNSDATEIFVSASEVKYPFQFLSDSEPE